eukprot:scaffold1011_cov96-Isochrysis_galbana.AAC.1
MVASTSSSATRSESMSCRHALSSAAGGSSAPPSSKRFIRPLSAIASSPPAWKRKRSKLDEIWGEKGGRGARVYSWERLARVYTWERLARVYSWEHLARRGMRRHAFS